jgi:hypothetical protein
MYYLLTFYPTLPRLNLQLEFDIYFWPQAAHVWTLHPNVDVLCLVLAFDFDILLFNIPGPSGYLGPLDGVQGSNS